jgi:hypothetical protein
MFDFLFLFYLLHAPKFFFSVSHDLQSQYIIKAVAAALLKSLAINISHVFPVLLRKSVLVLCAVGTCIKCVIRTRVVLRRVYVTTQKGNKPKSLR